jgi:hypothetical protein
MKDHKYDVNGTKGLKCKQTTEEEANPLKSTSTTSHTHFKQS